MNRTQTFFNIPLPDKLSKEDEQKLFRSLDEKAKEELLLHNIKLVIHIVNYKYGFIKCDREDAISIGTIGLLKAINTYNASKGASFATYAGICIENEIKMFLRSNSHSFETLSIDEPLNSISDTRLKDTIMSDEDSISEIVERRDVLEKIIRYLPRLSSENRTLIEDYFGLKGTPQRQVEIAEKMGINRSTVSKRISGILKELKIAIEMPQKKKNLLDLCRFNTAIIESDRKVRTVAILFSGVLNFSFTFDEIAIFLSISKDEVLKCSRLFIETYQNCPLENIDFPFSYLELLIIGLKNNKNPISNEKIATFLKIPKNKIDTSVMNTLIKYRDYMSQYIKKDHSK